MAYDSRAVKIKKADKAMAILCFNKDKERFIIRQLVKVEENATRTRSARNRGEKNED
jgi:hypothetical protein